MLITNRRVEAAGNCRALRRLEATGLRILVQAAWDYTMMGLEVVEEGIALRMAVGMVAEEEAPHMVAKLVVAGEGKLVEAEAENVPALEAVEEGTETVVVVVVVVIFMLDETWRNEKLIVNWETLRSEKKWSSCLGW
ncbi:hypothetical protein Droror1_Dr00011531 [Drosera rotundifolia]